MSASVQVCRLCGLTRVEGCRCFTKLPAPAADAPSVQHGPACAPELCVFNPACPLCVKLLDEFDARVAAADAPRGAPEGAPNARGLCNACDPRWGDDPVQPVAFVNAYGIGLCEDHIDRATLLANFAALRAALATAEAKLARESAFGSRVEDALHDEAVAHLATQSRLATAEAQAEQDAFTIRVAGAAIKDTQTRLATAEREREALREDAERYRWTRVTGAALSEGSVTPEQYDAMVDRARSTPPHRGGDVSDRRITVVEADHATWQWFGTLLVARPIPAWHPVIVAMAVRDVVRARILILGWRA